MISKKITFAQLMGFEEGKCTFEQFCKTCLLDFLKNEIGYEWKSHPSREYVRGYRDACELAAWALERSIKEFGHE